MKFVHYSAFIISRGNRFAFAGFYLQWSQWSMQGKQRKTGGMAEL
jgi:hypothetical protein